MKRQLANIVISRQNTMTTNTKVNSNPMVKLAIPDIPRMLFDGCSRDNPGKGGAGAHILMPLELLGFGENNSGALIRNFDERRDIYPQYREIWNKSLFLGDSVTNNEAEYQGLIMGLEAASIQKHRHLDVFGDSQLIINHMNNIYKIKAKNLFPLYERAKQLCEQFESITFTHVLRYKNKRADALANAAFLLPEAYH